MNPLITHLLKNFVQTSAISRKTAQKWCSHSKSRKPPPKGKIPLGGGPSITQIRDYLYPGVEVVGTPASPRRSLPRKISNQ
jgi:hypothetical protein